MVVFGIKTNNREIVKTFMEDTNGRLKGKSMVKNPFDGGVARLKNHSETEPDYYLVNMSPLIPPFYLGGLFALMINIVFFRMWLLISGLIVVSFGVFWNKYFFFIMLKAGLRKAGYKGPVKIINDNKMLLYILNDVI